MAGGTEQNRYLVSGAYFQQDGIVKNSGLKKYIVRLNDDPVLTDHVKVGISATLQRQLAAAGQRPGRATARCFKSSIHGQPPLHALTTPTGPTPTTRLRASRPIWRALPRRAAVQQDEYQRLVYQCLR
ncbi:MAG: hypothetical protein WKG07_16395 [Hymenobacter sp.]